MADDIISNIAKEFMSSDSGEAVDIITFVEASWGLNINLFPVQKFILKCMYGMELDDINVNIPVPDLLNEKILYNFTEQKFLEFLYEESLTNINELQSREFQELILVMGRRASKSTLASCITNYELYRLVKMGDPSAFFNFPPNTEIVTLVVAPTDDQASMLLQMGQNQAMNSPYLRERSIHQSTNQFDLLTDVDMQTKIKKSKGSLRAIASGCSSTGVRGRNSIVVIMDEMAFFLDKEGSRFSGDEVYRALTPSVSSFQGYGKILCLSSPYAKFGRFYDRYLESFDESDYALMFQMYTAMVNPNVPSEILRAAYRRDKKGFMCEYGAQFSDKITTWIDDETEFKKCISDRRAPRKGKTETAYFMGIDLGFTNDGSAICISHKEDDKICLDFADVWFSGSSDIWDKEDTIYGECDKYADKEILKMADIVEEIKELNKWFPIKSGIFDRNNGYGLWELLVNAGFSQIEMKHFSDSLHSEVFELTKRLYGEQLLDIYEHPVLVPELLSLIAEKRNKGKTIVEAPNRIAAHDDISDAFVRSVWLCYNYRGGRSECISTGAGGKTGITGSVRKRGNQPRAKTFEQTMMEKRKKHGEHPRGLDKIKKRR